MAKKDLPLRAFHFLTLQQDLRYAVRRLLRERRFAAVAVLILAVGIAACTVMFSVVQAVLLRPYNIDDPGRVVVMWPVQQDVVGEFTYNAARDLHRLKSLEDVASISSTNWGGELTLPGDQAFNVPCAVVSATFFDVLRARPLHGRTFRSDDDQPSSPRVLILSHALWTQRFGADPRAIGRTVVVREEAAAMPFEIVGVMPAEFFYPRGAQYWTPAAPRLAATARHRKEPIDQWFDRIGVFYGVGRLAAAATPATTRAETVLLLKAVSDELKIDLAGMGIEVVVTPLLMQIFGPARHALLVLMGAVTLVLLIACINVAGLLFARGASRAREMAVRAALGASRRVLMRQLLMESALLVVCGTVFGVSIAALSLRTLVALSPADIPRLDAAVLDSRVLVLSVFVAAVTTLVVGLAPAAHVSRTSLVSDLKGSGTGVVARGARGRARRVLIGAQVAGTLVLLMAAGLCVQSFVRLAGLDLGFDPVNVLTFGVTGLDEARYPLPAQRDDAVARLLSRFEQQPQVIAAAAVSQRPFEHGPVGSDSGVLLEGQPDTPEAWSRNPSLNWEAVTPQYFRAMGIRLLRGRTFNETDTENSPRVVIVSEAMASRLWPGRDPLGMRLRANASEGLMKSNAPVWDTVVGVVATARYREIESPRLDLYVPFRQTSNDLHHFTLRTRTKPLAVAPTVAAEIASFDKGLVMSGITTMEQVVRRTRGPWRFNMLVFSAFGGVALALAAVGLFALVGYEVSQRTREIGVRMALGAAPGDIVRLMVAQGAGPAAAGIVVGLFAAVGLTRLLSGILFGITPTDPVTFAEVVALLVVVVVLASYLPARRAASVDPQVVLREG
jgi:putative ABC transport system permease protein